MLQLLLVIALTSSLTLGAKELAKAAYHLRRIRRICIDLEADLNSDLTSIQPVPFLTSGESCDIYCFSRTCNQLHSHAHL